MTTPPTPADWYPDPENPSDLRYWDGTGWTEHRAPATPPAAPEAAVSPAAEFPAGDQATSIVSLPSQPATEQPTTVVPIRPAADPLASAESEAPQQGAHRAPDAGQEPSATQQYSPTPGQPYDTHPPTAYEPPSYESTPPSWDAPLPSWNAPPAAQPYDAPPTPSFEAASFVPPSGGPPEPPASHSGPSGDGPNKKLVFGILGGAAAILAVLAVIMVLVLDKQPEPTVTSSSSATPSTSTTTSSETTAESPPESSTASPTPPPTGGEASDGDYTFSVEGTNTGDTITSTASDAVQKTADGMFYVVYVNVTNTGTSPLTFVATFQQLSAAGQTFALDDEATAFLGGTVASVAPGDKVETPLVYDVPVGTEPTSIMLKADPTSAGVELPLQ